MALVNADRRMSGSIKHTWPALDDNGSTDHINVLAPDSKPCEKFTVETAVTGSPTDADVNLEGSLDGVTWFSLSGVITAHSAATMTHVINRPVWYIRATLTNLTAGTDPTITVSVVAKTD